MIEISQYRAVVGRWHIFTSCRPLKCKLKHNYKLGESLSDKLTKIKPTFLLLLSIICALILQCGDVQTNPGPTRSLVINHLNAHSLCPSDRSKKIDEIYSTLCLQELIDIICISETWLHSGIPDDTVSLPEYQIFRRDRQLGPNDGIGGGAAIYVHDSIPAKHRKDLEHKDLEMCVCQISHNNKKFIIASCYRAPGMTAAQADNFLIQLQEFLTLTSLENPEALFLLGDLNDHCLVWNSIHRSSELKNKLVDLLNINNLFQIIDEPTHITPTTSSLLDIIITDAPGYVVDSGTHAPIGDNYHCRIFCKVRIKFKREPAYSRTIWDYNTADFLSLTNTLSIAPWMMLNIYDDLDDAVDYFKSLLIKTSQDFIPTRPLQSDPMINPGLLMQ